MATITSRFKSAWNAFAKQEDDPVQIPYLDYGSTITYRPDRPRIRITNERSIISSIYTRLGIDVASVELKHVRHDDNNRYLEDIQSGLNDCLTSEPNIDQGPRAFRQDIALTMFDKGCAAIVPVDTTLDPSVSGAYDIKTMRVGEIVQWYPRHVKISLYNENRGLRQEITLPKSMVAIVENPLYSVMNEPNSTLQRLIRKLSLLDTVDDQNSSGKLDLIIQLPYVIKSEARRQQAEQRRQDIEFQLKGSKYGIAYTDGTEKITQLNRPVENSLLEQIKDLRDQLYIQLGLTPEVMNGTADEKTMLNYNNRTIDPILQSIIEAMRRTFLTKTARSQGQSIDYFRMPLQYVTVDTVADIADKLARNEVLSSNEIRQVLGFKPSKDPKADQLVNSNMPQGATPPGVDPSAVDPNAPDPNSVDPNASDTSTADASTLPPDPRIMASSFDNIDSAIDDAFSGLGLDDTQSEVQHAILHAALNGGGSLSQPFDNIESLIDEAITSLLSDSGGIENATP